MTKKKLTALLTATALLAGSALAYADETEVKENPEIQIVDEAVEVIDESLSAENEELEIILDEDYDDDCDDDDDDYDDDEKENIRNDELDEKLKALIKAKEDELEKINAEIKELKEKEETAKEDELEKIHRQIEKLSERAEDIADDIEDISEDIGKADYNRYHEKEGKARHKITKEELEEKKNHRREKQTEAKEFIREIKEDFGKADREGRREILSMIAELKKELKDESIGIFVRGKDVDFGKYNDVKPKIENERTLVPLRAVVESLKADVTWKAEERKIIITKDEISVELTIDNKVGYVNGEEKEIDVAPVIEKDRTLVPLRFLAEIFRFNVSWEEDARTVVID